MVPWLEKGGGDRLGHVIVYGALARQSSSRTSVAPVVVIDPERRACVIP